MQHRVARVAVDVPHPHLDRPFDYAVPAELDEDCRPGCRVRVRFAGSRVGGYVLARAAASGHPGRLAPLAAVVSAESVLAPEIARLARAVADRNAGTLADVLRLAVPPRHARVEAEPSPPRPAPPAAPDPAPWSDYPTGAAFLRALATGGAPRAVWTALPGGGWPAQVATAVAATLSAGRGAVVVGPDARDLARLDEALGTLLGPQQHVVLTAQARPAERYRRFLALRRGAAPAALGPRAAAWAPVADLGLVVVWDDGDDAHDEPRAPYGTTRDLLLLRAHLAGAAVLVGGHAPSVAAHALLDSGWAAPLVAERAAVRRVAPRVAAAGSDTDLARDPAARTARLPTLAWTTASRGLEAGPVLVQVPRRGYQPTLSCQDCRRPARCGRCAGPVGRPGRSAPPTCRWCGRPAVDWTCPDCGSPRLRAAVVGSARTAEELGRAFPGVPLRVSNGEAPLARVGARPALVVATPGAEPVADGGYPVVLLLDGWAMLGRVGLRAGEETLRRWANAAALARGGPAGRVVVMADEGLPVVAALARWDPGSYARREAAERAALGFPPATRLAVLDAAPPALAEALEAVRTEAQLPATAEILGPVPLAADRERALVRVPRADGLALARALKTVLAARSARKAPPIRVELDPAEPL